MDNRTTNLVVALAGLGAGIQALGLNNITGAVAFMGVAWCAARQEGVKNPNDRAPLLLAAAAGVFTTHAVISSGYTLNQQGFSTEFWRETGKAFGGITGVIGDIALRAKSDFNIAATGIKGAAIATVRNPGFWYSLCGLGIGASALVASPGFWPAIFLTASMACCAKSIQISTQRFLMAARGQIDKEEINNGESNLWSARSLPLLAATFIAGASKDSMLYVAAVGSTILMFKDLLLTQQFNPMVRLKHLITPPAYGIR